MSKGNPHCSKCREAPGGLCYVCDSAAIANTIMMTRGQYTDNAFTFTLALRLAYKSALCNLKQIKPALFEEMRTEIERVASVALLFSFGPDSPIAAPIAATDGLTEDQKLLLECIAKRFANGQPATPRILADELGWTIDKIAAVAETLTKDGSLEGVLPETIN